MKKWMKTSAALLLALGLIAGCSKQDGKTPSDSGNNPKPTVAPIEYAKGTITDTAFESEFVGVRFELPEGMIMATVEDMDAMIDFGAELVYKDADKKVLDYAKANLVYEMMAADVGGIPNVTVLVEKIPLSNMTEEQYLDNAKGQFQAVGEMIYEVEEGYTDTEIAGQSYKTLTVSLSAQGMTVVQKMMVRKADSRMIVFALTYLGDDEASGKTLLDQFKPY